MDFVINFLAGIVGGVISTFVFILLMHYFGRPNLKISDTIAVKDGVMRIKIVNRTRADLFDVQTELKLVTPGDSGSSRTKVRGIELGREAYMGLQKYDRRDKDFEYVLVFLAAAPDPQANQYLRFRVSASHGMTGFREQEQQIYRVNDIYSGDFLVGNTFEISM